MKGLQFLFFLFALMPVSAQEESVQNPIIELGRPNIINYSPEDYNAHYQNWDILQDDEGFIYVANGDAILQYDGSEWRKLELPNLNRIIKLAKDDSNRIYVGADREFGYIDFDDLGYMKFVSLVEKIPMGHRDIISVWDIFFKDNQTIFISGSKIYYWDGIQMKVVEHDFDIRRGYHVRRDIFVWSMDGGLFKLKEKKLIQIPGGDLFRGNYVSSVLPISDNSAIIATRENGLFLFDGKTIIPFKTDIDNLLRKAQVYKGLVVNNLFVFGTLNGGLLLMNAKGEKVITLDSNLGLISDQIYSLTLDNQSGLWLGMAGGISRLELFRPYSIFDKTDGLKGVVINIQRHKGQLYTANLNGLQFLKIDSSGKYNLQTVEGMENGTWDLLDVGEDLIVGTDIGVFSLGDNGREQINKVTVSDLYRSKVDTNRIYVGHTRGFSSIYKKNGKWVDEGNSATINQDVISIDEESSGDLWLGTESEGGILHLKAFEKGKWNQHGIPEIYSKEQGVPGAWNRVYVIDDVVWIRTDCELFRNCLHYLDKTQNKFVPDSGFAKHFNTNKPSYPQIFQNVDGHLLLKQYGTEKLYYSAYSLGNNKYQLNDIQLGDFGQMLVKTAFWDGHKILWIGGDALIRYDLNNTFKPTEKYPSYIRKVIVAGDSIIFAGKKRDTITELTFDKNAVRIEFAAPFFDATEKNQYQHKLEGFDKDWSTWSLETKKDYTNLPAGDYKFKIRAKNLYGTIGSEGSYKFSILSPWYGTMYAYILYFILTIFIIWLLVRWRSHQLKAQNEALEKLIAVRTSEVQHQANQLKIQAEKLQELDKAKSRFFANISHEFRTPLTLIKGPIEQLEQNFTKKLNMETVKMIRRNANRLLNMVNQLLDLSKIDEGNLKLAPTEGDVYKCLRAAASSFNSHAAQRNMDYRVEIPTTILWACFDRDKLENIIYNLLGNAFKFSGDGSKISFLAEYTEYGLQIKVSDAGTGIPTEKLPFIFDRFFQVDNSNTRDKGGSGIGLSLSKDLVELMDGTITVSSEVGKGTFFTVQLPIQEIKTRQKPMVGNTVEIEKTVIKKPFTFRKADKRNLPSILLVEDNRDMRHFITEQLIKSYKVIASANGEKGFQMALSSSPDLVITDLMMPKMDGIELCKKLKTDVHTSHIPVIMLTAKAGMENKIEGLETGADDYLTKPFDTKELLVRTKNLIEQRQKLRELYSNKEVQIDPKRVTVTSIDQKFLEGVLSLLEEHYSNSDFGVPQLQDALAMSKTQLHRKLKALTNEAPGELLRNFRLKRAAQLLAQKADSVTQIAYQVGFNNLSYFAKCFKELYGVAPSAY